MSSRLSLDFAFARSPSCNAHRLNASLPCSCDEQIGILNCGRLATDTM